MERSARQTTLQAKATAAAKLVLQDMDPAAKKKRQLFSSGPPQGMRMINLVPWQIIYQWDELKIRTENQIKTFLTAGILAIHVKTLRNFSKTFFFTSTFANCSEIRLYLKIAIQVCTI